MFCFTTGSVPLHLLVVLLLIVLLIVLSGRLSFGVLFFIIFADIFGIKRGRNVLSCQQNKPKFVKRIIIDTN